MNNQAPYELFIGGRYLRAGHRNRFISFISGISIVGLALGVGVLLVVLSVSNGFEVELRQRILGVASHATLTGLDYRLADWPGVREAALRHPQVVAAAPYIEEQGMLVNGSEVSGTKVRGIVAEDEARVGAIGEHMQAGRLEELQAGAWRIVLGSALAESLGVGVGDAVIVVVAQGSATPFGVMPRMRRFTVSGIFSAGMYEYDRGLALVAMADAALLYRMGEEVTGLRLSVSDLFAAGRTVREVALGLDSGGRYLIDNWTHRHSNFFHSIELFKSIMFVILLLVVAVAAVNIVSTLVMVVKEKQGDIAILRTMGVPPRGILRVFMVQGASIGLLGTVAGIGIGVLLASNVEMLVHGLEAALGVRFMDAEVYFMSDLPAEVRAGDVWKIGATAFLLCCLSTLYPAWRAARTQPAEALRHE
jgi:lipoprotein-releasing system permease protein